MLRVLSIVIAMTACRADIDGMDDVYYAWDDRSVHCTVDFDASSSNSMASIEAGLDRAKARNEVLELLVHSPGTSVDWDTYDQVLAAIDARGLPFLLYRDLVPGAAPRAGVALQYDDWWLQPWMDSRPHLARYNAHVTIFVAHYADFHDDGRMMLRTLSDDGNEIEAHGVQHRKAADFVEERGLQPYLDEEVLPSIALLRGDGYPIDAFAYPYGSHTAETDHAVLEQGHVRVVRSLMSSSELRETMCREW